MAACAPSTVPCLSADSCERHYECVAHRCVVEGTDPAPKDSSRTLLVPRDLRLWMGSSILQGYPSTITFGSARLGRTLVYLDFRLDWAEIGALASAFLIFEPLSASPPAAQAIEVTAYRVKRPLSDRASQHTRPELLPPAATGLASSDGLRPLLIDVTELLSYFKKYETDDFALAVTTRTRQGMGLSFASGMGGEPGPRLEIYAER